MPKDKPLTVEVVHGELVISIGIDVLKLAAENSPDLRLNWMDEDSGEFMGWKINNAKVFAKDVCDALSCGEEDGTTLVHAMLDEAMNKAIEDGSVAVDDEPVVVT